MSGAGPEGAGNITCTVYSFYVDQPYSGDAQVTVANQFAYQWDSSPTLVVNTGTGTGGEYIQASGGSGGSTAGYSASWSAGINAKTALDIPIPLGGDEDTGAAAGLNFTLGFDYNNTGEQSLTTTVSPGTTEWIAIGQLEDATGGSVIVATPASGPQAPKAVYKYAPVGNGDSLVIGKIIGNTGSPLASYTDPHVTGLYIDPNP